MAPLCKSSKNLKEKTKATHNKKKSKDEVPTIYRESFPEINFSQAPKFNINNKLIASFLVIVGDKKLTKSKQEAEVFDEHKVVGNIKIVDIEISERESFSIERCGQLIPDIRKSLESDFIVSLVHLEKISDGEFIQLNNQGEIIPYINKNVREISSGEESFLFARYLQHKGFYVETNGKMLIK